MAVIDIAVDRSSLPVTRERRSRVASDYRISSPLCRREILDRAIQTAGYWRESGLWLSLGSIIVCDDLSSERRE